MRVRVVGENDDWDMEYIYVVTVSERGSEKGEFFGNPTAYEDLTAGELAARMCCEVRGGRFVEVDLGGLADHVVQRWDNDKCSVWLERLLFEPAL